MKAKEESLHKIILEAAKYGWEIRKYKSDQTVEGYDYDAVAKDIFIDAKTKEIISIIKAKKKISRLQKKWGELLI